MTEQAFPLRPIPQRLQRSLLSFAGAGTLMAGVVYQDGTWNRWIPLVLLVACWSIPGFFFVMLRRQGFDPLTRFVVSETGLEAHYRDERVRAVPWAGVTRLVQVDGFRQKAWAIQTADDAIRWFGEVEDADAFFPLVAERTGLTWETMSVPVV